MKVTVWVVPVCNNKRWTILPKVYTKEGFAKSAVREHRGGWRYQNARFLPPVQLTKVDCPINCEDCPIRFKCYTEK